MAEPGSNQGTENQPKKLHRSQKNKILAGVFGGLGDYLNMDPVVLRLIGILVTLITGFVPGLVAYIISAIIIPRSSK